MYAKFQLWLVLELRPNVMFLGKQEHLLGFIYETANSQFCRHQSILSFCHTTSVIPMNVYWHAVEQIAHRVSCE